MKILITLIIVFFIGQFGEAQDTFSIVAVDPATGEVGSAGASCLDNTTCNNCGGVIIISDVKPGKGAIHTQSFWESLNQQKASQRMDMGDSPDEIIAYMSNNANDINFNASTRQYGVVDFDDQMNPRAAAFTGNNCFDYKNHIVGDNYAIQGNILLGQQILDSMEANFLNTSGSLAEKLMAALQGANVAGADTRCLDEGVSSLSAFIRVAKPTDEVNNLWLDINIDQTEFGVEPIDVLQDEFDAWLTTGLEDVSSEWALQIAPNPNGGLFDLITSRQDVETLRALIYDLHGREIEIIPLTGKVTTIDLITNGLSGLFFIKLINLKGEIIGVSKGIIKP